MMCLIPRAARVESAVAISRQALLEGPPRQNPVYKSDAFGLGCVEGSAGARRAAVCGFCRPVRPTAPRLSKLA